VPFDANPSLFAADRRSCPGSVNGVRELPALHNPSGPYRRDRPGHADRLPTVSRIRGHELIRVFWNKLKQCV